MATSHQHCRHVRHGVAVISFVAALLIIGTLVLWLFQLTTTTSTTTLGHYYSTGAFYAAESGIEMAVREVSQGNDIDSDGTIGTISDNDNENDDPALASGAFFVQKVGTTPDTFQAIGRPFESSGAWSTCRRVIEAQTE